MCHQKGSSARSLLVKHKSGLEIKLYHLMFCDLGQVITLPIPQVSALQNGGII